MPQTRELFVIVWFSYHRRLMIFLHFAVVLVLVFFLFILVVRISCGRRGIHKALPSKKALRHAWSHRGILLQYYQVHRKLGRVR